MHSLAAFRRSPHQDDLARLASTHLRNDLKEGDRAALRQASQRLSWCAGAGSLLGIGLGVWAAVRLRRARAGAISAALSRTTAAERPTKVVFADGRSEPIPDIATMLRPTRWGDYATYFFFGLGGLFMGGETGLLAGTWSATSLVTRDPDRSDRIEKAYRNFRVDCLRKEIDRLESGHSLFR